MSFTESLHPKTENIDKVDIKRGVKLIANAYDEMFDVLNSKEGREYIRKLSYILNEYVGAKKVLAGSGTSGRWAEFIAKKYSDKGYLSIMAGGPSTLLKAKEGAEDQPLLGIQDFRAIKGLVKYYLNISCSGRDKYSMGPIYDIIKNGLECRMGMLTFNGIRHMSDENLPGLDESTKSLVEQIELFNPQIGPEPIAGSTRMKGGSATQIMLEAAIKKNFDKYSWNKTNLTQLPEIIIDAVASLTERKNLYYIGEGNSGIIAIMDAAECPPTFGSRFDDVKAFINQGWYGLLSQRQLSRIDFDFTNKNPIDLDAFRNQVKKGDTVVCVSDGNFSPKLFYSLNYATSKGAKTHVLKEKDEVSLKILLNIISTETFVQLGHTYKNMMINLRLSNQKLVNRAVNNIIPEVYEDIRGKVPEKESILEKMNYVAGKYLDEPLEKEALYGPETYYEVEKIVPTTLLVMLGMDYDTARKELSKEIHIRDVINKNL